MNRLTDSVNQTAHFLLVLLWVYAGLSKLLNYGLTKGEMLNQVFPDHVAAILTWLVPVTELIVAGLLLFSKSTYAGYLASFVLLSIFTIYILLGLLNVYSRMPCSCGGVISGLSWGEHLAFNLFFLALTFPLITIYQKERRVTALN